MRIDKDRKSLDIEKRDIDYILTAYMRMYLFQTRNEDPDVITIPMFRTTPHPYKKGEEVEIQYIPDTSPVAVDIKEDGSDIPETSPESEAEADKKEEEYNATKAKLEEVEAELARVRAEKEGVKPDGRPEKLPEGSSEEEKEADDAEPPTENITIKPAPQNEPAFNIGADQPTPERLAKIKEPPGGSLPPGTPSDYGGKRDPRDFRRIARDLAPEKDVKEEEEVEIKDITDIPEPGKEK